MNRLSHEDRAKKAGERSRGGGGRDSRKQQCCNTNIAKILLHVLQNEERSCVSRFPVILEGIQINY